MKTKIAIFMNAFLSLTALVFVHTQSILLHRPETPEELLK